MAIQKELFINSLKPVEVDDRTNIPTAVLFERDKISIGYEAIERATDPTQLSDNFKLELGKVRPGRLEPPRFDTADGVQRSANEITKSFFENILRYIDTWIGTKGLKKASRVLIAEPLALDKSDQVGQDWLSNYRQRLKAILSTHFEEIDFLPEPFAVFQYYRYGLKHPLVATATKHVALVLDFGGGTFDVCVVETTAAGDVSAGGRNSKPLAAASIPVGGKFINDAIAKELIFKNLPKNADKAQISKAWVAYDAHTSDISRDFQMLRNDYKQFIRNIKKLTAEIESSKIYICNTISDWSLEAEYQPSPACQLLVPTDPLSSDPRHVSVRFDAYQLRDIFVNKIWKNELKPTIINAISRSKEDLKGRPITIVLLSGGSANIRWLGNLIDLELGARLPQAQVLELQESFQEVVAKGLAIECARRTFNEGTSDFKSVTYNRLCLVLSADGAHPRPSVYRQLGDDLLVSDAPEDEGVLLPAARAIGQYINKPLRWKFRLPSPPKKQLDYFFLKSSLDFEDISSLHNIDHRVITPPSTHFDSWLNLELTVREDGTAIPVFIYRKDRKGEDAVTIVGAPFFMDMTSGSETTMGDAYIGIDFGTSNSAISYVEQNSIRVYTQRAGDKYWLELNELVNSLPYPVANPLGRFIASTVERDIQDAFGEAFESILHFCFSVGFSEYLAYKGSKQTRIFKSLSKSSAGPLWGALKQVLSAAPKECTICSSIGRLLDQQYASLIDMSIAAVNDHKHHRINQKVDYHNVLNTLGNVVASSINGWRFGGFEAVTKKGFSGRHVGLFRIAHGSNSPFVNILSYEGQETFSELEAVLVNQSDNSALRLAPFMYWTQKDYRGQSTIAILDSHSSEKSAYRTIEFGGEISITARDAELSELHALCLEFDEYDRSLPSYRCTGLVMVERTRPLTPGT